MKAKKSPSRSKKQVKKKKVILKSVKKSAVDVYDLQAQLADMTKERDALAERVLVLEAGATGAVAPVSPITPESLPDEHPQQQEQPF